MNKKESNMLLTLLLTIFTINTNAYAGAEAGGGGGAIECPNSGTYLLDFEEASIPGVVTPEGIKIVSTNEPYEFQVQKALNRLSELSDFGRMLSKRVSRKYREAISIKRNVPEDYSLPFPHDAKNDLMRTGCKGVGVARWLDADPAKLWMDDKVVNAMSQTHIAGLWIHESVYKVLRMNLGHTDSVAARALTAAMFSNDSALLAQMVGRIAGPNIRKAEPISGEDAALSVFSEISPKFTLSTSPGTHKENYDRECEVVYKIVPGCMWRSPAIEPVDNSMMGTNKLELNISDLISRYGSDNILGTFVGIEIHPANRSLRCSGSTFSLHDVWGTKVASYPSRIRESVFPGLRTTLPFRMCVAQE
jgi:hypothetical protein